jgi:hypothetical protein
MAAAAVTNPLAAALRQRQILDVKKQIADAAGASSWNALLPQLTPGAGTGLNSNTVKHTPDGFIKIGAYTLKKEGDSYHVLQSSDTWLRLKGGYRRRTARRHHTEPRRTRKATLPPLTSTMPSLSAWYKNLFDRLGWTVLAKAQGKAYRVAAYKKSIASFLQTVNHVSQEYESHNRQHDLNVFRLHVRALQEYTDRHL